MNEQPNNETIMQSSSRDLQIIEDDAFSYEGYQVVRGEFFAHTYEPSFTFNANKVSVNTACIKKLPQTDFVQMQGFLLVLLRFHSERGCCLNALH